MNETVFDIDFTRALPPSLKNDENMLALAKVVAEELQTTARLSSLNLIYARIDELEENVLDILAYDFHVDWYSYDYPIEVKRAVIKDSVRVHKRLGTLYAVTTALGNVYPESEVEEWFDYNGEPFSFRVVLDVTNSKAPAEYFAIKKAVDSYKRLTAHMDDLIYQCRAVVEIRVETDIFYLSAAMTGKHRSGTYPQRNMKGGVVGGSIAVRPQGGGFAFSSVQAGTKPHLSTVAALRETTIQAEDDGRGFRYCTRATGQYNAGTEPQDDTVAGLETGGIIPSVTAEGFTFRVKHCGTSHCKNDKKGV